MRLAHLFGAAALALTVVPMTAAMADVLPPSSKNPTVAIGAEGTEESAPDLASISAGLITNDPNSEVASAKNNRDFTKVLAVVKKYKIAAKDIQTSSVSVQPKYNYTDKGEEEDGFTATNSITITMRDLAKIGNLMADLADAGANNISGPYFALEDKDGLRDKAREKAFDNGQRRALAYARKAGFKSVRLLTINENAGEMAYGDAAYASAKAAAEAAGSAMKMDVAQAPIEQGLVSETVFANFLFEMTP